MFDLLKMALDKWMSMEKDTGVDSRNTATVQAPWMTKLGI